jgi:potassium efflux system protein
VNLAWLERVRDGARDLFKASRFVTTFELCVEHARERPIPWSGSLVLLAVLVFLRVRAPGRIAAQAIVTRDVRRDSYRATLRSLGWTLLAALPVPTALFLAGALLQQVGTPGRFSDSLGRSLSVLVVPVLALQVLRWSVIDAGLAHAHFRWLRPRRETLRRWLPLAGAAVLPAFFVVVFASTRTVDLAIDVQARIGIFVALVALAFVCWSVLAAGRLWIVRGVTVEPSLARRLTRVILPVYALFASALALTGYVYTSALILRSLLETFALVAAVALVLGMTGRWFLLGERRLALRRAEEKRAAAQVDVESGEAPAEASDAAVTLEQVGEHTSRLLRTVRLALLAAGLVYVWSDMLPAVYRLDEVVLWTVTANAADGTPVAAPVTLSAAMLGILALALAVIGSRNLPGLIELSLLSRTGIDAASRYAVTSVLRYAIVIGGSVAGLGLLGLRWSQLQWMAAALTVGLGFGLQEIFANFVSGLILLFERPFRVGDIVTVGDLSGRVTRIRTRATTILDFDNKEIVIPNKAFITGDLVNWTLSDTTTRLTIKVGADYDADPALVRRMLMQAAAEDSRILKDPAPTCWLLNFGDSSLDFELRVFVGTIGDRLEVQNALHIRILELFAENRIVITYPQIDVHLRGAAPQSGAPPEVS